MENNKALQIFKYQDNEVRTVILDGEIYFVITDICEILEIKNVSQATSRLDRDGVCLADTVDPLGRKQNVTVANEPNLYRLIFRSDKPEAKAFQDWVYKEVLPSIRKTGKYTSARAVEAIDASIQKIIDKKPSYGHVGDFQLILIDMNIYHLAHAIGDLKKIIKRGSNLSIRSLAVVLEGIQGYLKQIDASVKREEVRSEKLLDLFGERYFYLQDKEQQLQQIESTSSETNPQP